MATATKPTTQPKKRLAGYYWVRLKGNTMAQAWCPAYYRAAADQWNLFGGAVANPEALLEVGPPMLSPDERPVTRGQRNHKVPPAETPSTKPRTRGRPRKAEVQAADTQEG